jgi:sugar lactone lactonase YvrE
MAHELNEPSHVCLSSDNAFLFVSDTLAYSICVFSAGDGTLVRRLGPGGQGVNECRYPMPLALSPDDEHVLVADRDNGCVHVLRVSDGAHVRSTCNGDAPPDSLHRFARYPSGLCVSASGDHVFVADYNGRRVLAYRVVDGTHALTISLGGGIFANPLHGPRDVCVSACGEWLFIATGGAVQVVRASDGELVSTIAATGAGAVRCACRRRRTNSSAAVATRRASTSCACSPRRETVSSRRCSLALARALMFTFALGYTRIIEFQVL